MEDTMTNTANQSLILIQHGRAVGHGYLELNFHSNLVSNCTIDWSISGPGLHNLLCPCNDSVTPTVSQLIMWSMIVLSANTVLSYLASIPDSLFTVSEWIPKLVNTPRIIAVMHHLANGMLVFHLEALRIYAAHLEAHTASNQDSPYLIPQTFPISQLLFAHHLSTQSLISLPQTLTLLNFNLDQTTAAGH
ncbi:hypothetical protein QWA68_009838 [Fusarium oxysporum]|nr:hypothetical protein QWA68_009838 [Fusarium oxysporum]